MTFQEYLKNRKNGSGSAADSVSRPENKFQAYVARRKAGNWASSADSFIQKIQSDYSARQQGSYQSPESIQEYKKSVSSELQELLDGVKDAKKYASQITDEEEREKYEKAVSDTQHYLQSVDWRLDLEERYWDKWDSEDSYNQWKKEYDRQKELDSYQQSILSRPDFEEYALKGAATENISLRDATDARGQFRSGSDELIGNKVTFTRDNAQSRPWETAAHSSIKPDIEERYTYMTDDEVSVYNYLLAKEGEEKADEYLATLTPYLNYRQGEDMAEKRKGSFLDTVGLSLTSGLDQFISGVRGWFTQEAEPVSATQIAAELARENISSDIGKFAFDAGRVLGNMAPSIALGMVTGGVGSAAGLGTAGVQMANAVGTGLSVGASAGGNNYQQALREGYSVPQARTYGLTTGALEAGLQTVLGATAKGAGLVTSKVSSSLSNLVKSASQKVAVKVGMSALGEGFEEYLQEILNPVVRNLTLGEDNEFHLFTEEALYNGMLGAITGGLFSAADAGASRVSNPFFSVYGTEGSVSTQTDESGNVLGYMHFNRQGDIDGYVRVAKDGEAAIHKPFTSYENIQAYAYVDKEGVTQYGRVNADGEVVTGSFRPNDTAEAGAASSVEADAVSSAETATGSVDTHAADGPANIPALYQLAQDAAANRQAAPAGTTKGAIRTNGTPAADGESVRAASARPEDMSRAATSGRQSGTIANTGVLTNHAAEANAVLSISGQEAAPVTVSGIGSVEDGNVRVTLSGGETVSLEDVSFDSQETESLYYAASDYTTPTARAFVSGYTGELPLKTYKVAFDFIRSQAREGVSFDTAVKQAGLAGQMMGLEAQQLAWYSGVNETAALHKAGENGTIGKTTGREEMGNGREETADIRRNGGAVDRVSGRGTGENSSYGGRRQEGTRAQKETRQSFARRAVQGTSPEIEGRRNRVLERHGNAQIAYTEAESVPTDSETGKALSAFRSLGIRAVVTDGPFETNRNGITTRHTDAVTAPDGTVYISSAADIEAARIVPHESVHALQRTDHPAYDEYYDALYAHADYLSESYKTLFKTINEAHYGGRLDLNDPDSVRPVMTELTAYIHEWLTVNPKHAEDTFAGMFRDWDAVIRADRELGQAIAERITGQKPEKERRRENGRQEEIHIRQYQGSAGGPDGRGKQSTGQRSEIPGVVEGNRQRTRSTAIQIASGNGPGQITFPSVKPELYTAKQKRDTDTGATYGCIVYHIPRGAVLTFENETMVMDRVAFVLPGTNTIFAMDRVKADYIEHELYHILFARGNRDAIELYQAVKVYVQRNSDAYAQYKKIANKAYEGRVNADLLLEEITADLCEYAMSGSEQMHRRLDGLFPDGMLEKLAEQARDVFAANRKGEKGKTAEEAGGVRYSLEGYTEHQKENWANSKSIVLYESQEQLERFIDNALSNNTSNQKFYFGRIGQDLARRIWDETGVDIEGYNCTLRANEVKKILNNSHGNQETEALRGQRAVTKEDLMRIPEIIQSPDNIQLDSKLFEGKPVILFSKTDKGRTTVVSYVSRRHQDLTTQTMYITTKRGSLATTPGGDIPFPQTSETLSGTASNNSIAKSVNTVNDSLSQSGAGVIWETPENEVSEWIRDQAAVLDAIGKEFGYRFLIRSSLLGGKANGQTVPGSREIVLSADSMEEALLYWAGHEVIHDLRVSYPEGYEEISRQVLEYLGQQERFDLNRRKQQLIREYRRGGLELTEEEEEEEIVCNGAAVAFADEDFIRGCAERNWSLLEWLKEKLNSLLARIREVLARLTRTTPEVRAYAKAPLETLTRLQQSVETALRESAGRAGGRQSFRRSMTTRTSTDSQGRTLSPEQEEFFRNSAIRDKDGHLQVMYHATDAQFTVFDKKKQGTVTDGGIWGRGFYFDVEESFALEFGSKATAYYLNVARPYRTTYEATCGEIMELFRENGIRIRFRMDPEEGLNRFIRRFGYKKFSEALRFLGYDGVFVSGNECAVYEPNQIKRIDNLSPTEQEDVRYAAKEKRGLRYSLQNVDGADIDSLTEENEALRRQVELLKQEFRLTEGHQVSKAAVEGLAAKVLRQTKSVYDKDTLAGNLQTVFRYIANDPEANFQETMEVLTDIAGSVLQESTSMNRDLYNEYADMREYFRKTPLSLSEAAKAELTDGYADFRSRNFGMLNLRSGGTLLNELWGEICEKWPQFFDADLAETEQPYAVVDALNAVKPAYINPYGMNNADAARDLAMQLYYEYFELPEVHTFADKHKAELEKLRAEYRRKLLDARSAARDQYNKRLKEVQEWNAGKRRELSKKIRETENAKRKQQLAAQYRRLMDRKAEQLERQKAKFRTQREIREANRREREEIRKLRTRIRSIADELSRRLVKETDQKNIPEDFKKPVAELLSMLDFTTDRTNPDSQASRHLRDLQAAYAKLESDTQGEETPLTDYFDPDILNMIEEVAGLVEGKRVVDLGVQELSRLKDLLKSISTIVHNAGRLFREDKVVTVAEAGKEAIRVLNAKKQFRRAKIAEGENNPFGFMSDLLGKGMLTPYYFFKQFEGTPVWELFQKLYDGENVYVRLSNQALKFARETMKKHGYWNWKLHERRKIGKDEAISFRTVNGDEIKLTLGEMLSLYATARRENMVETHHLDKGGFTLGSKDGAQRGILFTSADFQKLCGMLTEEQINCADEMVEYLSTVCAEQGNEVSLKMFGIRKFQEKYYFPFKVSGNVIRSNPGESQDIRLKNRSFTKARTDRATAPLMIQDFFEVWAGHVEEMAMYNAFALPLEDFTRVWNYRYQGDPGLSVKFAIEGAFGKRANSYITNFLRDLNGGVLQPVGEEWFSRVVSTFKRVSVLANLSVAIQQVSAIVRATAMINPKYLAPRSISQARLFREYDEARRYVPVYILKDWGYFDTNMTRGTYQRMIQQEYQGAGKIKGFFTDSNYRSDAYGILAQKGDEANWGQLWYAVKNETRERHPEVRYGSEEFYQLAAERVTDIIRATQVYDSVFKRSEIMRSTGAAAKMATAFMAEPITSYNMLLDAAKVAGSRKKGSKKKAAKIVVSVVLSMVLGNLLKSVISAMRDDDDEKKDENGNIVGTRSFWDKYRDAVLDNLWDDPLGMIPFVRDIVSIAQGYEVKRTDMELFQKLYYALTKLDSDKYTTAEKADAVIGAVAALFGEPYANISRDARAIYHTFFADNVNDGTASYRGYLLYRSVLEGDKETYQELYNGYREDGKTDKEIQGVLRSALAAYSPLVSESVAAKLNGDLNAYEADIQKMIQSGFQREMVIDAVKNFEQKLKTIAGYRVDGKTEEAEKALAKLFPPEVDEETRKTIEARIDTLTEKKAAEPEEEEEETSSSLYTYTDLCEAIERGESDNVSRILQDMRKNGKEDKTIRTQVTRYFKPLYIVCYQNRDKEGMKKIEKALYALDLGYDYKDFEAWTDPKEDE